MTFHPYNGVAAVVVVATTATATTTKNREIAEEKQTTITVINFQTFYFNSGCRDRSESGISRTVGDGGGSTSIDKATAYFHALKNCYLSL